MIQPTGFNNPHHEPTLSPDDQRLLDALVEGGFDRQAIESCSPCDAQRLDAILGLLGLLNDYPVEDGDETLLHATLARIDRYEDEREARLRFESQVDGMSGERAGWRIPLPNFITVAAVLLIAVSVFWPMIDSVRQRSMDMACANNMRLLGYAFGQYAGDNNGALPLAMAGSGASWDTLRNVVNLKPLLDGHYCSAGHLNCPGHHDLQVQQVGPSYSYRWFIPDAQVNWSSGRVTIVIGDRNPLIDSALAGRVAPALSMSMNHRGRGQNVLASDGATLWLEQPVVGVADNIWLPHGTDTLRSGIAPEDPLDVFLAH